MAKKIKAQKSSKAPTFLKEICIIIGAVLTVGTFIALIIYAYMYPYLPLLRIIGILFIVIIAGSLDFRLIYRTAQKAKSGDAQNCPCSIKARYFFACKKPKDVVKKAVVSQNAEYLCAIINALPKFNSKVDDISVLGYIGLFRTDIVPENHPLRQIALEGILGMLDQCLEAALDDSHPKNQKTEYTRDLSVCVSALTRFGKSGQAALDERIDRLRRFYDSLDLRSSFERAVHCEYRIVIYPMFVSKDGDMNGHSTDYIFCNFDTSITIDLAEYDNLHKIWTEQLKKRLIKVLQNTEFPGHRGRDKCDGKDIDWEEVSVEVDTEARRARGLPKLMIMHLLPFSTQKFSPKIIKSYVGGNPERTLLVSGIGRKGDLIFRVFGSENVPKTYKKILEGYIDPGSNTDVSVF